MTKAEAMRYIGTLKNKLGRYVDDIHRAKYEEALDYAFEYMEKKNSRKRKPTITEMKKRLKEGRAIYGRFWGTISRISASSLEVWGKRGYVYCSGQGQYDWYTPEDYGKTWGWHIRDIDDSCLK